MYTCSVSILLLVPLQKTLEQHNGEMLLQLRSLFKYCQGAAHVWDVHELGLARTERALQEKLDECRRKHDNENQVSTDLLKLVFTCILSSVHMFCTSTEAIITCCLFSQYMNHLPSVASITPNIIVSPDKVGDT